MIEKEILDYYKKEFFNTDLWAKNSKIMYYFAGAFLMCIIIFKCLQYFNFSMFVLGCCFGVLSIIFVILVIKFLKLFKQSTNSLKEYEDNNAIERVKNLWTFLESSYGFNYNQLDLLIEKCDDRIHEKERINDRKKTISLWLGSMLGGVWGVTFAFCYGRGDYSFWNIFALISFLFVVAVSVPLYLWEYADREYICFKNLKSDLQDIIILSKTMWKNV